MENQFRKIDNNTIIYYLLHLRNILCFIFLLTLFSCKPKPTGEAASKHESLPEERNMVEVMVIRKGDFTREMVSNGKLAALQKAQLWFKNGGIIATINVRNGEQVARGAELARLQNDDYLFALKAGINFR
jgi:membrane fusion protein, multidrug efflux system